MAVSFSRALLVALIASAVSPAMAAVQSYSFSSFITNLWTYEKSADKISNQSAVDTLKGSVEKGMEITGIISYDNAVPITSYQPSIFYAGEYGYYQSLQKFSIFGASTNFTNGTELATSTTGTQVGNDNQITEKSAAFDSTAFYQNAFSSNGTFETYSLHLLDSTASIYNSVALLTALDFSKFSSGVLTYGLVFRNGDQMHFDARLTSFSALAPVPEPETYAMIIAGLSVMSFMVRRKKPEYAA